MQSDTTQQTDPGQNASAHPDARRPWTKPEAKTAEVAQATLAGSTVRNGADLATCAS